MLFVTFVTVIVCTLFTNNRYLPKVKEQRKEYRKKLNGKKTCMSDDRLRKLQDAGFVFRCRAPRKLPGGGTELVQPTAAGDAQPVHAAQHMQHDPLVVPAPVAPMEQYHV